MSLGATHASGSLVVDAATPLVVLGGVDLAGLGGYAPVITAAVVASAVFVEVGRTIREVVLERLSPSFDGTIRATYATERKRKTEANFAMESCILAVLAKGWCRTFLVKVVTETQLVQD